MNEISYKNPLYNIYKGILRRCGNQHSPTANYRDYGGRGIKVCDRWLERGGNGFRNFVADMGEKPTPKHSIDRIDNDGNYSPDNCRWATRLEQLANRRIYAKNVSGFPGVTSHIIRGKIQWQVKHGVGEDRIHIGVFNTMEDAIIAKCEFVILSLRAKGFGE